HEAGDDQIRKGLARERRRGKGGEVEEAQRFGGHKNVSCCSPWERSCTVLGRQAWRCKTIKRRPSRRPLSRPPQDEEELGMASIIYLILRSAPELGEGARLEGRTLLPQSPWSLRTGFAAASRHSTRSPPRA